MNIIFGKDPDLDSKYTVLELDTLLIPGNDQPVTAYCIVENIPLVEMAEIDRLRDLHTNLIKNYRLQNWKFCEDSLEYLMGKWNREVDTFYLELLNRVNKFKQDGVPDGWTGIIDKTV